MFTSRLSFLKLQFNRHISVLHSTLDTNEVLSKSCLEFIHDLHYKCVDDYNACMKLRDFNNKNSHYGFREDTEKIRHSDWAVDKVHFNPTLNKRHVEITGPANNKRMVINAFNSTADGYMIDLEDSMAPTWENVINGHTNIYHAVRSNLTDAKYDNNDNIIKEYTIRNQNIPTIFVRSRGLHMKEYNILDHNSNPIPASIFDIGVHLFNNGTYLYDNNIGPFLYIPKLESYEEALFINKVITQAQNMLGIPHGTTKATVLIETYPAIFQTHEIIYALKDHIAGLNCGRWDYLYSMMKSLKTNDILPDKTMLTMDKPFLKAYVEQIVTSCHKRKIHAMGGMSAFIPANHPDENKIIYKTVEKDKLLEIDRGCDGAWVAHPGLIPVVQTVFQEKLNGDNQIYNFNYFSSLEQWDFTKFSELSYNKYTYTTLKNNINISMQYIAAWLHGNGAVAINGLMEDLATAEISIHQIRQWYYAKVFDLDFYELDTLIEEQYKEILQNNQVPYASNHFLDAKAILKEYIYNDTYLFLPEVVENYNKSTEEEIAA